MNLMLVGTSRCDVPAREAAGGTVAPLHAARTAQRAIPTGFRVPMRAKKSETGGTVPQSHQRVSVGRCNSNVPWSYFER